MTSTVDKIKAAAKAEVGYQEGRSGGHWNNREKFAAQVPGMAWVSDDGQPWCAVFNCWLDLQGGLKPAVDFPLTASCDVAGNWFKGQKRWSQYPAVGAWVLFGTSSDLSHTGRVVAYDDTWIWTVEGNTNTDGSREGDGVYAKKHARREARIMGYGYPRFPEGIDSADPKLANAKPTTVTPAPKPVPAPKPPVTKVHLSKVQRAARKDPLSPKPGMFTAKADVLPVEVALAVEGLLQKSYADGHFGTHTREAYAAWQRQLGYTGADANGIPGGESLRKLGAKHDFRVV